MLIISLIELCEPDPFKFGNLHCHLNIIVHTTMRLGLGRKKISNKMDTHVFKHRIWSQLKQIHHAMYNKPIHISIQF